MNRLSWRRLPKELWVVMGGGFVLAIYQSKEAMDKASRGYRSTNKRYKATLTWEEIPNE